MGYLDSPDLFKRSREEYKAKMEPPASEAPAPEEKPSFLQKIKSFFAAPEDSHVYDIAGPSDVPYIPPEEIPEPPSAVKKFLDTFKKASEDLAWQKAHPISGEELTRRMGDLAAQSGETPSPSLRNIERIIGRAATETAFMTPSEAPRPSTGIGWLDKAAELAGTGLGFISPLGAASEALEAGGVISRLPAVAKVAETVSGKAAPVLERAAARAPERIASAIRAMPERAVSGGISGGVYGAAAGLAEGKKPSDVAKSILENAALFAGLEAGLPVAGAGVGEAASRLASRLREMRGSLPAREAWAGVVEAYRQAKPEPAPYFGRVELPKVKEAPAEAETAVQEARQRLLNVLRNIQAKREELPKAEETSSLWTKAYIPATYNHRGGWNEIRNFDYHATREAAEKELAEIKDKLPGEQLAVAELNVLRKLVRQVETEAKPPEVIAPEPPAVKTEVKAPEAPVEKPVERLTANAADLAADYKARGMDSRRAWSQFVIDRALKPEMDAKDFYKIYEKASPKILEAKKPAPKAEVPKTTTAVSPEYARRGEPVEVKTMVGRGKYEWRPAVIERVLKNQNREDVFEVIPEGSDSSVRVKAENVRAKTSGPEAEAQAAKTAPQTTEIKPPGVPEDTIKLHAGIDPHLKEFYEQDIVPAVKSFLGWMPRDIQKIVNVFSPRTGVPEEGLNIIMKALGERNKKMFEIDQKMGGWEKMFSKMSEKERVEFIDRIKTGQPQKTPELQQIADIMRLWDDAVYSEIVKYRPSVPYLENHFRVFWRKPDEESLRNVLYELLAHRPLEGSKGFMKRHTLETISEGIERGLKPRSTNPVTLFKMAQADAMKFVTAQRMWEALKEKGFAKFVRFGKRPPEGYARLDDRIARVYFPVEEGMVNAGEWFVEKNVARLLNNFLSRDLIRDWGIGHSLLWLKNHTTAIELSLSPFHFIFETVEAAGSQFGIGLMRVINQGLLQLNPAAAAKGLREMATSPLAAHGFAKLGGKVIRYIKDPAEFIKTTGGQSFIKQFPDAMQIINDLFAGGGKLSMWEGYRVNSIKAFQEALSAEKQGIRKGENYIGAVIRLAPALNEMLMKPLFEVYIPRLKIGVFFKEYSQQLEQYAKELAEGKISRNKLARETWDRVENRFGEMNFDNLFWNRTFKTALQFMFRSVTWKLGNIRGFGGGVVGQAKEFAEPLKFVYTQLKGRPYEFRAPRLDPSMAWLTGIVVTTVTLSTIIQKAFTGEWPSELRDYFFPKTGQRDREGNQIRVSVPTYFRDLLSLKRAPLTYIEHSFSGLFSKLLEAWHNQDFYGNFIYDPQDPGLKKLILGIAHVFPVPFSVSQYKNLSQEGTDPATRLMAALGFVKAPKEYIRSNFQLELQKAYSRQRPHIPLLPEQQAEARLKQELRDKIRAGKATPQDIADAVRQGVIKQRGATTFVKNAKLNTMQIMWKYLSPEERARLWPLASPEEQEMLRQVDAGRNQRSGGWGGSSRSRSWGSNWH